MGAFSWLGVRSASPSLSTARGLRPQPRFVAARTLNFCSHPLSFLCHPSSSFHLSLCILYSLLLIAPQPPATSPKDPVSRAELDAFGDSKTDTPPGSSAFRNRLEHWWGACSSVNSFLSYHHQERAKSGTVAIQGTPGLSRHPAHGQFSCSFVPGPPWNLEALPRGPVQACSWSVTSRTP